MPSPNESPTARRLRAQSAAYKSWANTFEPAARTAPGRNAFLKRFERQVDPEGRLAPAECQRRAIQLRRAFFLDLTAKSANARKKAKAA